jgi:hypothetical protein
MRVLVLLLALIFSAASVPPARNTTPQQPAPPGQTYQPYQPPQYCASTFVYPNYTVCADSWYECDNIRDKQNMGLCQQTR